jgi:nucleoside-triphosphatase THEP1
MTHTNQLSEKWIKASILGTIWASSEIVLGSFLHNLRVPFSGNILTAIGLIILISASYKWKERGLFWRAGIICALLKTMSPSAVIFGPMVAIISEALLLEFSVRMLGKTIPGFILGSVLAMTWNLFQKIFNFVIFYGYNIVEVYTNLMKYAQRQLQLQFDAVWAPLFLLLVLYAFFGTFSALIAIKTGRKLISTANPVLTKNQNKTGNFFQKKRDSAFHYSMVWLLLNIVFMICPLLLIGKINFGLWVLLVATVAIVWALRYKRALRQLVRPKLWIFFVIITMITAFVFTRLQPELTTTADAVLIGVEMNLRAILLIMGFSVLGTELYHPKIREWLAKSYFKQLPPALELSLESLPSMLSAVPDFKSIVKNPVLVIAQMMGHADDRIEQIKKRLSPQLKVIVITGEIGVGKTTCIQNLVQKLKAENISVGGIFSERIMKEGKTTGYKVVNVSSEEEYPFLSVENNSSQNKIGKYSIDREGLALATEALKNVDSSCVTVVDEIGKLEMAGGGWANELHHLFNKSTTTIVLSVRKELVNDVIQKWNLNSVATFEINKTNAGETNHKIVDHLKNCCG